MTQEIYLELGVFGQELPHPGNVVPDGPGKEVLWDLGALLLNRIFSCKHGQ